MQSRLRVRDDVFECIWVLNKTPTSRFAVIVSTKIDKRAVKRNRMKRLILESIRHLVPTIQEGWDCVVIVKKRMSNLKQTEVEPMMATLLGKAEIKR